MYYSAKSELLGLDNVLNVLITDLATCVQPVRKILKL